jgi:hypothetical protein
VERGGAHRWGGTAPARVGAEVVHSATAPRRREGVEVRLTIGEGTIARRNLGAGAERGLE